MWADQDDLRDRTFVRKAVAALEADPDAVLCHSHAGAFVDDPRDVRIIITMGPVDGVGAPVLRYVRFLRWYSDTAVYGLMRSDALRLTRLWRTDLGAANALVFELLLLGKFIQIPEVLYLYSARGFRNRPAPREEYARLNPGKKMPAYYFPFLVLALNQTDDIRRSSLRVSEKLGLVLALWGHVSVVFGTKAIYRVLDRIFFGRLPERFTDLCDAVVEPRSHFIFLNATGQSDTLFPKAWALRGRWK